MVFKEEVWIDISQEWKRNKAVFNIRQLEQGF